MTLQFLVFIHSKFFFVATIDYFKISNIWDILHS